MVSDGQHAARQIALSRPEMNQRGMILTAQLPLNGSEGSEAAAVFANLDGATLAQSLQRVSDFLGEGHARIIYKIAIVVRNTGVLLEVEAGDAHGGDLDVPIGGHMVKGDLEAALFPEGERVADSAQEAARVAQNHLIQGVAEFDGHFNLADAAIPAVRHLAGEIGHLLIEKVRGAAHFEAAEFDPRDVSLFPWAKWKRPLVASRSGPAGEAEPEERAEDGDSHDTPREDEESLFL